MIKAPPLRNPMYPAKLSIRTKTDVTIAIREDILRLNVLKEIRVSPRSPLRERNLKITQMPMEEQRNLS